MIRIEGNGLKVEIPADCKNAVELAELVLRQLSGAGKSVETQVSEVRPAGLLTEEEAVKRERAAVERARRKWKSEEDSRNHARITRDENVILAEECSIECENELIINKNINKKTHSNNHSANCGTQRSLAKVVRQKPRKQEAHDEQYLMDFMYDLPEEWQTEKVQEAWKVYVGDFEDFQHSSSKPKRRHTKEELAGILDIMRYAYANRGEEGLLATIWQAIETQRRYVWDLPNSCRRPAQRRYSAELAPSVPEPEPEFTVAEQIELQRKQVELFRSLGSVELRKSAEEKLRELEALNK